MAASTIRTISYPVRALKLISLEAVLLISTITSIFRIYSLLRLARRNKILILAYHGVSAKKITSLENFDGKHVHKDLFEKQVRYLKKYYNILSLDDYINSVKYGKKLPANSVILTFDDGYRNNFTVLAPVAKKHKIPITIFLT